MLERMEQGEAEDEIAAATASVPLATSAEMRAAGWVQDESRPDSWSPPPKAATYEL